MHTHLSPRRLAALAVTAGIATVAAGVGVVHSLTAGAAEPVPASLAESIRQVTSEPRYQHRVTSSVKTVKAGGPIMVADAPFDPANLDTLLQVITDVANLSVAIYEAY